MAGIGSFSDPATLTLSVDPPAVFCETMKVTVALAPLDSLPRLHEKTPDVEQLPDEDVEETSIPVVGAMPVNAMLVEVDGPKFLIVAL